MGELQTAPFQFTFNGFLKVAFQGSRITSDAGLILVRELDERLGLAGLIAAHLRDSRSVRVIETPPGTTRDDSSLNRIDGAVTFGINSNLRDNSGTGAHGGSSSGQRIGAHDGTYHFKAGSIVVDSSLLQVDSSLLQNGGVGAVLVHELGHVTGCHHVTRSDSFMGGNISGRGSSGFDQDCFRIFYGRPIGNVSPDADPDDFAVNDF